MCGQTAHWRGLTDELKRKKSMLEGDFTKSGNPVIVVINDSCTKLENVMY